MGRSSFGIPLASIAIVLTPPRFLGWNARIKQGMIWPLVILTLIILGWYVFEGHWNRQLFRTRPGRVCANIHPQQASAFLVAHPEAHVLDVRSAAEFSGGSLPGAVHVPYGDIDFEQRVGRLDKARPVLVYCAGGFRSRKAAAVLKQQGFTNIQHLHRGYHSWRLAGLPVEQSGH